MNEDEVIVEEEQPQKKSRGRPKGSKDKYPRKTDRHFQIDPKTGLALYNNGNKTQSIMARMGDERVSAFVQYHIECMKMGEGCNKKDPEDLYRRFYRYLEYCYEKGILPNNMNCYLAVGVSRADICNWKAGRYGNPGQRKFAEDISTFFASVHEQAASDGIINPVTSIFWQKVHDGLVEAQKVEVENLDPLGEKRSAEEIAKAYDEVELPD